MKKQIYLILPIFLIQYVLIYPKKRQQYSDLASFKLLKLVKTNPKLTGDVAKDMKKLIAMGANLNFSNSEGFATLDYAAQHKNSKLEGFLLARGAQIAQVKEQDSSEILKRKKQMLLKYPKKIKMEFEDYWKILLANKGASKIFDEDRWVSIDDLISCLKANEQMTKNAEKIKKKKSYDITTYSLSF
jgi:hypothetical protein